MFRILILVSTIFLSATFCCADVVLIDYDDGIANGIHDVVILNGGFESDTSAIDKRSFQDTPAWTNLNGTSTAVATRNNMTSPIGGRNAVVNESDGTGDRIFTIDTGYVINDGDVFATSLDWRDASAWSDSNDQLQITLFTSSDDTLSGTLTDFASFLVATSTLNSTWESSGTFSSTATSAEDAKRLFFRFSGNNGSANSNGFARVDNVYLAVVPEPTALSAWLVLLGFIATKRNRRA